MFHYHSHCSTHHFAKLDIIIHALLLFPLQLTVVDKELKLVLLALLLKTEVGEEFIDALGKL